MDPPTTDPQSAAWDIWALRKTVMELDQHGYIAMLVRFMSSFFFFMGIFIIGPWIGFIVFDLLYYLYRLVLGNTPTRESTPVSTTQLDGPDEPLSVTSARIESRTTHTKAQAVSSSVSATEKSHAPGRRVQ